MAWPTLNYRGDYGSGREFEPRVDTLNLGDGFSQDSPAGMNTTPDTLNMTFTLPAADADALYALLQSWGGVQRFKYRVMPHYPLKAFKTLGTVKQGYDNWGRNTVTATFKEVFEVET